MIPLSTVVNPAQPELKDRIAEIPNTQGVYLLRPRGGNSYLGWTAYLPKRLTRLVFGSTLHTNLAQGLEQIEYWLTGSRLETSLLLYWLARKYHPESYRKRLKLREPWFVNLVAGSGFPRLAIRNRVSRQVDQSWGPFPNREGAERFQQGVLSLFQIRRCDEVLHPSEFHPGCIYGEMNHCMRPCQLAASSEEYGTEVSRVSGFLHSNGKQSISTLTAARERASEDMDFEEAARLHKEIEKVKAVIALRGDLATLVSGFNGIAVTPAYGSSRVILWAMIAGIWQAPLLLDFSSDARDARSLDQQLRERLAGHLLQPRTDGDRGEEMALLSRWYHSSWRDGSWYEFRDLSELNYRKLVREISTIVRDSQAESPVQTG